jgi:hypothetical protein
LRTNVPEINQVYNDDLLKRLLKKMFAGYS